MPRHVLRLFDVNCAKTAEPTICQFGLPTQMCRRKHKFNRICQVAPMCPPMRALFLRRRCGLMSNYYDHLLSLDLACFIRRLIWVNSLAYNAQYFSIAFLLVLVVSFAYHSLVLQRHQCVHSDILYVCLGYDVLQSVLTFGHPQEDMIFRYLLCRLCRMEMYWKKYYFVLIISSLCTTYSFYVISSCFCRATLR